MNIIARIEIPYEELKHYVINIVGNLKTFQFKSLCHSLGKYVIDNEIVKNSNDPEFQSTSYSLQKEDENRVREIVWDLIIQRVLTIGNFNEDSWPWLSLTEYGKKHIKSEIPIPNDQSGYIERIKKEIPNLDKIIEVYLIESIRTYNINQLLSSTITLGCASERALILLIDKFAETYSEKEKRENFSKKIKNKFIVTRFKEFDKKIKPLLSDFPYELNENYEMLTGVFQMIRKNRNEVGHPTGRLSEKEPLFANLQVFIGYCKYIYNLMEYLEEKKH